MTVGDRLRKHVTAADPHQSRAYTDERLAAYLPARGGEVQSPAGDSWLSAVVPDDPTGNMLRLRGADGSERTRLRNSGALYLDVAGKTPPLCIGAPGFGTQTVINVSSGPASPAGDGAVFQVKGDGSVHQQRHHHRGECRHSPALRWTPAAGCPARGGRVGEKYG